MMACQENGLLVFERDAHERGNLAFGGRGLTMEVQVLDEKR
jgi:hypothetical protein